jgi:hypothetical protein
MRRSSKRAGGLFVMALLFNIALAVSVGLVMVGGLA